MQRVLSTAALLGLLIATAAAFAITERLKLVKSPVFGTFVSKTISPTCGCARGKAKIRFKLRHGDDLTLTIVDGGGDVVRTLFAGSTPRGEVSYVWDGKDDFGQRAPDGRYRPEVHLARQHRTILLPNPIALDTRPPRVVSVKLSRAIISPDGDGIGDSIRIHYKLSEPARVIVYYESTRLIRSRSHQVSGTITWQGLVDGAPLAAGLHVLWIGAQDRAGNLTPAYDRQAVLITVRYIQLASDRVALKRPGVRFGIGVDTDAKKYSWTLDGRHGVSSDSVLRLRAPDRPGTYALVVRERTHTDRATLVVSVAK